MDQPSHTRPLYRIHWRNTRTGETSYGSTTFSLEIAEIWVKSLNADKDNKALGLFHWLEPAGYDEAVNAEEE